VETARGKVHLQFLSVLLKVTDPRKKGAGSRIPVGNLVA